MTVPASSDFDAASAGRPASADSGAASADRPAGGDLRRVIGFWGGTALIVGITIGAGIFRKPYSLSRALNDPWMIMGLWAAFGVISVCGALALAELASMMPRTGGTYVYLRAAYGDSSAFVFGWIYLLVATPAQSVHRITSCFARSAFE